jgi:hypothetical protein
MSQKEAVGCRGRRYTSRTTICRFPQWKEEEGSVYSVGHVGGGGATHLGDSWASGQVEGIVAALLSAKAGDMRGRGE